MDTLTLIGHCANRLPESYVKRVYVRVVDPLEGGISK